MSNERVFEDAFNLLCGKKLGEGVDREVFECRLRPELVVKVEADRVHRSFANPREMQIWQNWQYHKPTARWLAPCEYLSPDGRILLQRRTQPISPTDGLPDRLPAFLTDIKTDNFGLLDGRVVCHDYSFVLENLSLRLRKY